MIFADEAGDFEFVKKENVSRYFVLATVAMRDVSVCTELVELRRDLAWRKYQLGDYFHASTDRQAVRDEVFKTICGHEFQIQATIMEKSKAYPRIRPTRARFYQYGWFYHMKFGTPKVIGKSTELMVVAASLGTKKEKTAFQGAVQSAVRQTVPFTKHRCDFCPSAADPGLQVADYCAWAVQRKWESGSKDTRSYELIADRITYEYDLWAHGTTHHY